MTAVDENPSFQWVPLRDLLAELEAAGQFEVLANPREILQTFQSIHLTPGRYAASPDGLHHTIRGIRTKVRGV